MYFILQHTDKSNTVSHAPVYERFSSPKNVSYYIATIYSHPPPPHFTHARTTSVLDRHVLPTGHLLLSFWTSAASQAPPLQGGRPLTPSLLPALRTVLPHTQAVSHQGVGEGRGGRT